MTTLPSPSSFSVIIPTLDEESCLGNALASLRSQNPGEILVVDGGSTDATPRIARDADRFLVGARGRAVQMNLGARHARGELLLFLHADCTLEPDALESACQILARRSVAAGCFTMRVRDDGPLFRCVDWCATARVRLTGLVYGDQGLFLRRRLFDELGGFPPLRLMEDLYFSRTLRSRGRIAVSPRRIFVSPRRWQRQGLAMQTARNWTLTAAAALGVSPDTLARFYPVVR
jgi:rSAM/selenodomain-associated transferase 2